MKTRKREDTEQSEWPSIQNSTNRKLTKISDTVTVYTRDEAYLVEMSMYELNSFKPQQSKTLSYKEFLQLMSKDEAVMRLENIYSETLQ